MGTNELLNSSIINLGNGGTLIDTSVPDHFGKRGIDKR